MQVHNRQHHETLHMVHLPSIVQNRDLRSPVDFNLIPVPRSAMDTPGGTDEMRLFGLFYLRHDDTHGLVLVKN